MTALSFGGVSTWGTVSERLVQELQRLGVRRVFGVSGGGVAPLWGALSRAEGLELVHTQHESGAAFCATEASLATGELVAVFTTTGPGLTNALTGLLAARQEGARILALSGVTPTARRYRGATQESGPTGWAALWSGDGPFDLAATVEHPSMLGPLLQRIEELSTRGGGFVAHLGLPMDLQGAPADGPPTVATVRRVPSAPDPEAVGALAADLRGGRVAMIVGFEARGAGEALVALAEALDAAVVTTPRGKGAFPASHPLHRGVLGFAGHTEAERALAGATRVLALGTALGEGSSQYTPALADARLIWVHPDPGAVCGAFPDQPVERWPVAVADLARALLARLPPGPRLPRARRPLPTRPAGAPGVVDPWALLDAVQRVVVDGSDAWVMAESGNAFAYAIHYLQLDRPRLRVSVGWGSMGHFAAGVVGAALATRRRAVALVGDGSMLMQHEVATAVHHRAPATWVVLNDSGYGMCREGTRMSGIHGVDCELPPVDFAAWAGSLGVPARRVTDAGALDAALREALTHDGPSLLDVVIDRAVAAPIAGRVRELTWASESSEVAP